MFGFCPAGSRNASQMTRNFDLLAILYGLIYFFMTWYPQLWSIGLESLDGLFVAIILFLAAAGTISLKASNGEGFYAGAGLYRMPHDESFMLGGTTRPAWNRRIRVMSSSIFAIAVSTVAFAASIDSVICAQPEIKMNGPYRDEVDLAAFEMNLESLLDLIGVDGVRLLSCWVHN